MSLTAVLTAFLTCGRRRFGRSTSCSTSRQWASREVSLVVPDLSIPAPVTGVASGFRVSTPAGQPEAVATVRPLHVDWIE